MLWRGGGTGRGHGFDFGHFGSGGFGGFGDFKDPNDLFKEMFGDSDPFADFSTFFSDVHVEEELVPDVLHIVREALSNVAKHATATQVMLDAEIIAGDLVISVRDTGGGFDADTVVRGNGLENMAERAVLLGAHLGVTSTIGEGTTVTLTVPLHPTAPEQEDNRA